MQRFCGGLIVLGRHNRILDRRAQRAVVVTHLRRRSPRLVPSNVPQPRNCSDGRGSLRDQRVRMESMQLVLA